MNILKYKQLKKLREIELKEKYGEFFYEEEEYWDNVSTYEEEDRRVEALERSSMPFIKKMIKDKGLEETDELIDFLLEKIEF